MADRQGVFDCVRLGGRRIEKESLCNERRYRAAFLERSKMCPRVCLSVIVSEKERERGNMSC